VSHRQNDEASRFVVWAYSPGCKRRKKQKSSISAMLLDCWQGSRDWLYEQWAGMGWV